MNVSRALRIKAGESVAFVGAGGKSSLIFALAKETEKPVVITTTTHLGTWQAELAHRHQIIHSMEDLELIDYEQDQSLLITGPANDANRLTGLPEQFLFRLWEICRQKDLSLLIEADGARQLSLKAPASYEPVIPDWVDRVVVIAGLGAIGKRLTADVVHRPELFSNLSGLGLNDIIRVEDVIAVLGSDQGGLKAIPEGSWKMLFLNQADDAMLQAKGKRIAMGLADSYDQVVPASLKKPEMEDRVLSVYARTAGIVLAAGGSERLGSPKQLLEWQGVPFVVKVVENALAGGLKPLIVVTGADHDAVQLALKGLPVKCVYNPDWSAGQSTSMQTGLAALKEGCDSAMFLLSDQPQISSFMIRQLLDQYAKSRKDITAPLVRGQRGNPVIFSCKTFDALKHVAGDRGGRAIFSQFDVDWLEWVDVRVLMDVDQPGDDKKLRDAYFQ